MSAAAEAQEPKDVLVRRFEAAIAAGDGRTIDMRIVPFGERATIADGLGGVPKGVPYEEEWMPGAFDKQMSAAHRVLLNFEHGPGLANVIGRGIDLSQPSDGYHASFRVLEGPDGDKALQLVKDGVLTGASVEAIPLKSVRSKAGIVQRVKAHLDSVALCRLGAFPSAVVTAVREETTFVDEDLMPIQLDEAVVERCRRLGIKLPDRLAGLTVRAADGDQKASNRIAMMIATAQNFITDEDDPEDKATMQGIISELQRLRAKEGTEPA